MPSLRRTFSSPLVRSSPYSSTPVVARGQPIRRSSGSETSNRRVLADIEWWRVTEGQCDLDSDQASEDYNSLLLDMSLNIDISASLTAENSVEHPVSLFSPLNTTEVSSLSEMNPFEPPLEQFSALAITPSTPTRPHRTLHSTSSSLESTPEPAEKHLDFGLVLSDLDFDILAPPPVLERRRPQSTVLPPIKRSFTFADCLSLKDDHPSQYADFTVSPLSSAHNFFD